MKIRHGIAESTSHVCVSVSVEFVNMIASLTENFHIGSRSLLSADKYLNGSSVFTDLHFNLRIAPGESGYLFGWKARLVVSDGYSCVSDLRIICSLDDYLCGFLFACIVETDAGLNEAVPCLVVNEGIFREVCLQVNFEYLNSDVGLSRLNDLELVGFLNHLSMELFRLL